MTESTKDIAAEQTPEIIEENLTKRGHIVTSWEQLGQVWMEETGVETTSYRIGLPSDDSSPTVFKVYFPPNCRIEAHTHACDYSEIILQGSQKVSGKWLHEGDIRIGLANRGYGPLIAGEKGVTVLVIFKDGHWPPVQIGAGDGSTINAEKLLKEFTAAH
jgi:DNA-directed RNA polymerase subunit L